MNPIEEKLLAYPDLPEADKRAVEAYVADHPEWAPLLHEAHTLKDLLDTARSVHQNDLDDAALAFALATRRYSSHAVPDALQPFLDHIDQALQQDPDLKTRYFTLLEQTRILTEGTDALAQFERLTGHKLASSPAATTVNQSTTPPRSLKAVPPPAEPGFQRVAQPPHILAFHRWAIAACVGLVALYGILFLASRASQSDLTRMASIKAYTVESNGTQFRGTPATPADAADALYDRAFAALREARTSTLGLFPRYDATRLEEAASLFEQVIASTPDQRPIHAEAWFFLGKTRLAQGRAEAAQTAFRETVRLEGSKAEDARTLLNQLGNMP